MKLTRRKLIQSAAIGSSAALLAGPVWAESKWGSRPVRMVVPYPPGGSSDLLGRLVAKHVSEKTGIDFYIENKPGGTTQIGSEIVANAEPDGQTLLMAAVTAFTVLPLMRPMSVTLDDFDAAGGLANYIGVMAVRNDLPIHNLSEFVDYAKSHPDQQLSFGSAGNGSFGNIYGLALAQRYGFEVLHVPYRGSAAAVSGLLGGETDFIIDGAVTPMILDDRVRSIAIIGRNRHPKLPDIPTSEEAGFELPLAKGASWGLLAPRGTPVEIIDRLSGVLKEVLAESEIKEVLANANAIPNYQTAKAFREGIISDQKLYAELLPEIGLASVQ